MVDTLDSLPENTVVLDGTGRRWSRESWCTSAMVCALRWVGPSLAALSTEELAARGPHTVISVPGEPQTQTRCLAARNILRAGLAQLSDAPCAA